MPHTEAPHMPHDVEQHMWVAPSRLALQQVCGSFALALPPSLSPACADWDRLLAEQLSSRHLSWGIGRLRLDGRSSARQRHGQRHRQSCLTASSRGVAREDSNGLLCTAQIPWTFYRIAKACRVGVHHGGEGQLHAEWLLEWSSFWAKRHDVIMCRSHRQPRASL